MKNAEVAEIFERVADLLEFENANPFRVRAYRNGARTIRDLTEPVADVIHDPDRSLSDLPGIGKDLAEKCESLVVDGRLELLEELTARIPESVLTILRIPGLGPKKAAVLHHELGITNLEQLREACQQHRVQKLKGFGAKTETSILAGIDLAATADARMLWAQADELVQDLRAVLDRCHSINRLEAAGSYRRGKETVGDLDLLAVAADTDAAMNCLAHHPRTATILARGETKMSVRLDNNVQVDLRVVPASSFGAALQYFTGSKEHNVILRGLAKQQGFKVNEWGVFRIDDESYVTGETEEDVYAALGLPYFPPELREARHEFDWARTGSLPELITLEDLQGDLHMHTNETDGKDSLERMVQAARERHWSYIAITDHSQRVTMARGLNSQRLRDQWQQIDRLNASLNDFTVLKGIECDILEAGGMDLPNDVLHEADWVLASVHYGQRQSRQQITDRIVGAIRHPNVSAIAHPTGRLLNRREAYEVDMNAVMQAAAEYGKALELNANPRRLDLDDVMCASAKLMGIPIVINSDAHSRQGLNVLRYGILQARRAGLTKHDVLNAHPVDSICKRR